MCSKLLGQTKGITVVKKSEKEDAEEDSAEKEEEAGAATDAPDNSSSDEKLEDSDVTVVSEWSPHRARCHMEIGHSE